MQLHRTLFALILFAACFFQTAGALAQSVLTFHSSQRFMAMGSVAFADSLSSCVYLYDAYFFPTMFQNPFFHAQCSDSEWPAVLLAAKGNAVRWRDAYLALATWGTTARFDQIGITTSDGRSLLDDKQFDGTVFWAPTGGEWQVSGGQLRQTDATNYGQPIVCYMPTGGDTTIRLRARKESGAEGFLVAFSYIDPDNYVWWNLGGWNNTQHAIEQCVNGKKTTLASAKGNIQAGRDYNIRIELSGPRACCYLNDVLIHDIVLQDEHRIYASATISPALDSLYVHLANPSATPVQMLIRVADGEVTSTSAQRSATAVDFKQGVFNPSTAAVSLPATLNDEVVKLTLPASSLGLVRLGFSVQGLADALQAVTHDDSQSPDASGTLMTNGIYNLDGRRVALHNAANSTSLKSGIYLVNGRKKVIK